MREAPEVLDLVLAAIEFERQEAKEQAQVTAAPQKLRELQARVDALQNAEERFRTDTQAHTFKSWLPGSEPLAY